MIVKKMIGVFDNLEDFEIYLGMYKDTEWTLVAEHVYIDPFKDYYIHTYLTIHVKEVGEKDDN